MTLVLLRKFKNYKEAMRLTDFFTTLENRYNLAVFKCRPQFLTGVFINGFRYPFIKCRNELQLVFQIAVDEGEYYMAFSSSILVINISIAASQSLKELSAYIEGVRTFSMNHNFERYNQIIDYFIFVVESLRKENTEFIVNLKTMNEATREVVAQFPGCALALRTLSMIDCYLLNCIAEAVQYGKDILSEKVLEGSITNIVGLFYFGLSLCALSNVSIIEARMIKKIQRRLKYYTEVYPENYQFYLLLIKAEVARINKMTTRAMYLYSKATKFAETQNNFHNIGIASLCAGKFYIGLNLPELAKPFFITAHYAYQHWGAKAVAKKIETSHPEWFRNVPAQRQLTSGVTTTMDTSIGFLDVLSLLKATQVISSEIQLDILLKKLIIVLIQNAGAQRGALIMKTKDMWYVAVEGTTVAQQLTLNPDANKNIDQRIDLPLSLIRYVQRTQQMVQAQSTFEFESFREDPYIIEIKPQSVIVMPINYQGQLNTILFLENRNTSHAFTAEHVHVLNVLSSQAVISLENAKLYYQATHDPLTGLANRNLLHQMFDLAVLRVKRNLTTIAILFLDLDGFKKINDTLGHEIGDQLLIYFAERLKACIREDDLAVRLGGDEFVAMLEDADKNQLIRIAERILDKKEDIIIQGHRIHVGTSIGISFYPEHGQDIQELLKKADVALYRVKQKGKGMYQFYSKDLDQELKEEHQIEKELETAAERGEFFILYQPIYSAKDQVITHFEALLRWQHPRLGLLEPEIFIHVAETSHTILAIGAWVFKTVFRQLKQWQQSGLKILPIAINVSGLQFKNENLSHGIATLLKEIDLDPAFIELEFTENIFIDIDDKISDDIVQLKQMGIKLTLDDFGSHYSSLAYLRRFEVDQIKIDQSFIHDLSHVEKNRELIASIIRMAHNLKLKVIAEGVETKEQMEFLVHQGVDAIQGFYLARPLQPSDVIHYLKPNF